MRALSSGGPTWRVFRELIDLLGNRRGPRDIATTKRLLAIGLQKRDFIGIARAIVLDQRVGLIHVGPFASAFGMVGCAGRLHRHHLHIRRGKLVVLRVL